MLAPFLVSGNTSINLPDHTSIPPPRFRTYLNPILSKELDGKSGPVSMITKMREMCPFQSGSVALRQPQFRRIGLHCFNDEFDMFVERDAEFLNPLLYLFPADISRKRFIF